MQRFIAVDILHILKQFIIHLYVVKHFEDLINIF